MGTYISIPYVTRRSVSVEPSKPVTVQTTDVDTLIKVEPIKEEPKAEPIKEEPKAEPIKEEPKEEVKEDVKEEPKTMEEPKEEPKNEVVDAEVVMPELLPKRLSITIPSESDVLPDLSEQVAPRIPEFRGNMNSESHAIKKFNRRHRKHQN